MSTHQTTAKRIANALLAAVLAIGLMVPTFALTATDAYADPTDITSGTGTIPSTKTEWYSSSSTATVTVESKTASRTYRLIQIFSGSYSNGALSDIVWGASIGTNYNMVVTKLQANTTIQSRFTGISTAASTADEQAAQARAVAAALANITEADNSVELDAFADCVYEAIKSNDFEYALFGGGTSKNQQGLFQHTVNNVHDGYYLVKEERANTDTSSASLSRYMLEVADGTAVTINAKDDDSIPSAEKNLGEATAPTASGDTYTFTTTGTNTDVKVGDELDFQVTSTIPVTTGYSTYSLVVNDIMSSGLTFKKILEVKIGSTVLSPDTTTSSTGTNIASGYYKISYYSKNASATTDTLSDYTTAIADTSANGALDGPIRIAIDLGNLKNYTDGSAISIMYTATVNDDIRAGSANASTNKVILEYSNDPFDTSKTATTTPGAGGTTTTLSTGGIYLAKVTSGQSRLTGAEFSITGDSYTTAIYYQPTYTATLGMGADANTYYEASNGEYVTFQYDLDNDGTSEYVDPNNSSLPANALTSLAEKQNTEYTIDTTGGSDTLTVDGTTTNAGTATKVAVGSVTTDTVYYKLISTSDGSTVVYVTKKSDGSYDTTTYPTADYTAETEYPAYKRTETAQITTTPSSASISVGTNGLLSLEGLSAGTYYIRETVNPANYQILDYDIKLTVEYDSATQTFYYAATKVKQVDRSGGAGTYTDTPYTETESDTIWRIETDSSSVKHTYTGTSGTTSPTVDNGLYVMSVVNDKGGSLPSTGGIGTTIFYIVGGLLVAGAVVYLVTRRRMKAERE